MPRLRSKGRQSCSRRRGVKARSHARIDCWLMARQWELRRHVSVCSLLSTAAPSAGEASGLTRSVAGRGSDARWYSSTACAPACTSKTFMREQYT